MDHVITAPPAPRTVCDGRARLHTVPAARDNLIWLLECLETGAVAAVDGPGVQELDAYLDAHGLTLTHILTTHTHGDHVGLHHALQREARLDALVVVGCARRADEIPGLNHAVDEGDGITVGALEARVWRTDGHLNDHLCFVFDGVLFCGDTLFTGGCGYLFDGPPEAMARSLWRLATLPGETLVCCAHEYTQDNLRFAWLLEPDNPALAARIARDWAIREQGGCTVPSTMAEERATNPFLRPGSATLQRRLTELAGVEPPDLMDVFAATRAFKNTGPQKQLPEAELPV